MTGTRGQWWEYLAGLDFPVSRDDLVRRAQEYGASTELLHALRSLPVIEFGSVDELADLLGTLD